MRCVNPFVSRQGAFGCGQCLPCRHTRRKVWAHRILLESLDHGDNSFVTLTYSEENLPKDFSLYPEHLRDWLKRLRRRIYPAHVRFYGVGEYGSRTERPHYHVALFGWPACFGSSERLIGKECSCRACSVVRETWSFGHVLVGRLEKRSALYISRYVTKKMTRRDDPRLHGRHPEFARMSLKPGLGASAMHDVASVMMCHGIEDRYVDVPHMLAHGKVQLPLGRYLRRELRKMVGKDEKAPEGALQKVANQMQIVRSFAFDNDRSVRSVFREINEPFERNLAAREIRGVASETL